MTSLKIFKGPKAQPGFITLKPKAHIHIMGVCGTAMFSLAGLLKKKGFLISGSDKMFYPPISEELKKLNIKIFKNFEDKKMFSSADLLIVGNVMSRNMPIIQSLLKSQKPYTTLPEVLKSLVIENRHTIITAGTHGKTTTGFLTAWALKACGLNPGFMAGGLSQNFKSSFRFVKNSSWFVLEGDEYDTAFFEKTPKFIHYPAHSALLTGIEFDHADIYKNLSEVKKAFKLFIRKVFKHLIINGDSKNLCKMKSQIHPQTCLKTYGLKKERDYQLLSRKIQPAGQLLTIKEANKKSLQKVFLSLPGEHNALNALGVWALLRELGLPKKNISSAFKSFKGVRRRFQNLGVFGGIKLIEDFAHHPTAVKAVIKTAREIYPGRRLLVLFEPRSHTARKNIFQKDYEKALDKADKVFCLSPYKAEKIPPQERFSAKILTDSLNFKGRKKAFFAKKASVLASMVQKQVQKKDIILILSNGDFGGIYALLKRKFAQI